MPPPLQDTNFLQKMPASEGLYPTKYPTNNHVAKNTVHELDPFLYIEIKLPKVHKIVFFHFNKFLWHLNCSCHDF